MKLIAHARFRELHPGCCHRHPAVESQKHRFVAWRDEESILSVHIRNWGACNRTQPACAAGVKNDQALMEQEERARLKKTADAIADSFHKEIVETEKRVSASVSGSLRTFYMGGPLKSGLAREHNELTHPMTAMADGKLKRMVSKNPLLEEVFFVNGRGQCGYATQRLLYRADHAKEIARAPLDKPGQFRAGEIEEFRYERYERAEGLYESALSSTTNRILRAELLLAIGRVRSKTDRDTKAEAIYKQLAHEYGNIRSRSGIPLGLAAELRLAVASDPNKNSTQRLLRLYERLLDGKWPLTKTQFNFYTSSIEERLRQSLSFNGGTDEKTSRWRHLQALKMRRQRVTERLLAFRQNAADFLGTLTGPIVRERRWVGKHSFYCSAFRASEEESQIVCGIIWNSDRLLDQLQEAIQLCAGEEADRWHVGGTGEALKEIRSRSPTLDRDLAFPRWSLHARQADVPLSLALFASRRGFYFYVFLLLAGILAFGLVLTISALRRELELANLKSDFVATMSHELKSPLTSIRQISEMFSSGRVTDREKSQKYSAILMRESKRLSHLIDNVLDFAGMEAGQKAMAKERIAPKELINEAAGIFDEQLAFEGIQLRANVSPNLPEIVGDRQSLLQAISNLIDNAIKYSGSSREIVVEAKADDTTVNITVRDFGLGIPSEEQKKIFDRFYRGGARWTRKSKGCGLGLTLVKKIAEAHQGSVLVESHPGAGSSFRLQLPQAEPLEKENQQ